MRWNAGRAASAATVAGGRSATTATAAIGAGPGADARGTAWDLEVSSASGQQRVAPAVRPGAFSQQSCAEAEAAAAGWAHRHRAA